jgi:hypothetical protein
LFARTPVRHTPFSGTRHPDLIVLRLDTHHTLPEGTRLRLRLPQVRDRAGLVDLLTRLGLQPDDLDAARILRFDPRGRTVVCATVWTGTGETMVGIIAGARDDRGPDLLVTDERLTPGVGLALRSVLDGASGRRRAA